LGRRDEAERRAEAEVRFEGKKVTREAGESGFGARIPEAGSVVRWGAEWS